MDSNPRPQLERRKSNHYATTSTYIKVYHKKNLLTRVNVWSKELDKKPLDVVY